MKKNIEEMISKMPLPSASRRLDARMADVFAAEHLRCDHEVRRVSRAAFWGVAMAANLLGILVGWSLGNSPSPSAEQTARSVPNEAMPDELSRPERTVEPDNEALLALCTSRSPSANLFGGVRPTLTITDVHFEESRK